MRLETASDHDHIRNEALLSQRTTPLLTARASRISDIHDLRLGRNQSRRFTSTSEALSLPLLFPQAGHSASASASLRSPPPMPLSPLPSRPPPPGLHSISPFLFSSFSPSSVCSGSARQPHSSVFSSSSPRPRPTSFLSGLQYLQEAKRDNDSQSLQHPSKFS